MMTKSVKKIAENAEKEFSAYKEYELKQDKETIFAHNYKIRFFDELHDYLTAELTISRLSVIEQERIESEGTNFISLLFDYYLKLEYANISSWEDIENIIFDYCCRVD